MMPIVTEQRLVLPPALGEIDIQRAAHPETTLGQHVRVQHDRGDIPAPEEFLNRAHVVAGLGQVRGGGVPEGVASHALREPDASGGLPHVPLQHGLVQMVRVPAPARTVVPVPARGKEPPPGPMTARAR